MTLRFLIDREAASLAFEETFRYVCMSCPFATGYRASAEKHDHKESARYWGNVPQQIVVETRTGNLTTRVEEEVGE